MRSLFADGEAIIAVRDQTNDSPRQKMMIKSTWPASREPHGSRAVDARSLIVMPSPLPPLPPRDA
jgi:hypothetical protein